jgi:hypothetical protein
MNWTDYDTVASSVQSSDCIISDFLFVTENISFSERYNPYEGKAERLICMGFCQQKPKFVGMT